MKGVTFRLGKIPVQAHWTFAILLAAPLLPQVPIEPLAWVTVLTLSILAHELGHAVMARRAGLSPRIRLFGMGGQTSWRGRTNLPLLQDIGIHLAGPLAGLLLGGVAYGLREVFPPAAGNRFGLLNLLVWVNLGWGLVNLLPLLPLDGGRVLESLWMRVSRSPHAWPVAAFSVAVTTVGFGWCWMQGNRMGALLAAWFCFAAWEAFRERRQRQSDHSQFATLAEAGSALRKGDWETAYSLGRNAFEGASTRPCKASACEIMASALVLGNKAAKAELILAHLPEEFQPSPFLRACILRRRGRLDEARPLLERLLAERPATHTLDELLLLHLQADQPLSAVALLAGHPGIRLGRETRARVALACLRSGDSDTAAHLCENLFAEHRHPDDAYNAACSHSRAGRHDDAVVWLTQAVEAGFNDLDHLDSDEDWGPLRGQETFASVRARLAA